LHHCYLMISPSRQELQLPGRKHTTPKTLYAR
jgi:hypothetical protein